MIAFRSAAACDAAPGCKGLAWSGSDDKSIRVWNEGEINDWGCKKRLIDHAAPIQCLTGHLQSAALGLLSCATVQGELVLSAGKDNLIKVWDAAKLECIRVLYPPHLDNIT